MMSIFADETPPSASSHVQPIQISRGEFNKASNQHPSTAHPINYLADELLSEIFYRCIPHNRNPRLVLEAPLLLTLVCQRWRAISMSTPQLWNRLHILYMDDCVGYDAWPNIIAGIESWLTRSGTLPLSISISSRSFQSKYQGDPVLARPSVAGHYPAFYRCLTVLIARHAPRWSTFSYVGTFELLGGILAAVPQERLTHSSANPFRSITSFRAICKTSRRLREGFPVPFLPIFVAPTLRELSLQDWHPDLTHVKWKSITQLSIYLPVERKTALGILSQCMGLEACALNISHPTSSTFYQIPYVQKGSLAVNPHYLEIGLPVLTTLCIWGESDDEQSIWHLLHTPNLRHFLYYPHTQRHPLHLNEFNHPHPHLSPLSIFLNQCSSLESLSINPTHLAGAQMLAILQSCPRIIRLVLDQHYHDKYPRYGYVILHSTLKFNLHPLFKQELVLDSNGTITRLTQPLLPDLKSLSLLGFHVSDSSILEMLVDFCIDRVYTNRGPYPRGASPDGTMGSSDNNQLQPPATLERIEMRLSGIGCDIASIICLYAKSVGRRVGEDLIVDISYPVTEEDSRQDRWPFVDG
ncbi:hypothetical protein BJ165DRAFT_1486378 [Panaeolus papilionaceus]|nr:hypothetical protein BJ165DRAFT_1486378 [Panaeolus papilionaceus]